MDLAILKARIILLWMFQIVNFLTLILVEQSEVGHVVVQPGENIAATIAEFFALPCFLSWQTLVLPQSISRWANTLFGLIFGALKLAALVGWYPSTRSWAVLFNEAWGLIAAIGIIWYAWRPPHLSKET
jgi:hypothetical protein